MTMRNVKRAMRRQLMKSRVGRWLLIGFYETYLDQFARAAAAIDAYNLRGECSQASLRFRLHRCIHRLEKGLSMSIRRKGAGKDAIVELIGLMGKWQSVGGAQTHPTFLWGLDV